MPFFKSSSDFDLVNTFFCGVDDKIAASPEYVFTPTERMVEAIWGALGVIGNGSFQYFFENELDALAVADSLDQLELGAAANAFREAAKLRARGKPFADWKAEHQYLEENESEFDALAEVFIEHENEIVAKLAANVRSQSELFDP